MFRGFTSVSLFMADLKLCTQRSARPLLAGWYRADVRCLIPFLLRNIWNSSDLNCGPLLLTNWDGTPYLANKLCSFLMVLVEVVVSIFSIPNHLEWASSTIKNMQTRKGPAKSIWVHFQGERSAKQIHMELLDSPDYCQNFCVNLRVPLLSFCECPGSKSNGLLSPIIHHVG